MRIAVQVLRQQRTANANVLQRQPAIQSHFSVAGLWPAAV